MLGVEAWTTIRYLQAQGVGIRAICRQLGVSRTAVRHALRSDGPPHYQRPVRVNQQLEPYETLGVDLRGHRGVSAPLRWRAQGAAGRQRTSTGDRRQPGAISLESAVPGVVRPLSPAAPRVSAVPGPDQGKDR